MSVLIVACKNEVKKPDATPQDIISEKVQEFDPSQSLNLKDLKAEDLNVVDSSKLDNGIRIKYFRKGNGAKLKKGDLLDLNYVVKLKTGYILEGNHQRNERTLPFLLGYGMQPKGWDLALSEMHVGDFAEIFIPSKFARGEAEIKGIMPKNSDNYLTVEVLAIKTPTRQRDGVKVWNIENGVGDSVFNENNSIVFNCIISTISNPRYYNSWKTGNPFKMQLSDYGIIPGLKKALLDSKKGDHFIALVPTDQAYGKKGLNVLVKPNEDIYYYIEVEKVGK